MTFINGIFLLLSGQGFYLAFLLYRNKKIKNNPWISLYILAFSLVLLYWDIYWIAESQRIVNFTFHLPVLFSLGPLAYLCVLPKTPKVIKFHFLAPSLLLTILLAYWLSYFFNIRITPFQQPIIEFTLGYLEYGIYGSLAVYTLFSFIHARSAENLWIAITLAVFSIGQGLSHWLSVTGRLSGVVDYIIALFIITNFYSAGYYYFNLYKPFSIKHQRKLNPSDSGSISTLIEKLKSSQSYLDPDFRLEDMAREVNVPMKDISAILQAGGYSGFKDFVNKLRIDHSKLLLVTTNSKILAIALESGFSNKVTFIQNFKRYTSTTPYLYRSERKISPSSNSVDRNS